MGKCDPCSNKDCFGNNNYEFCCRNPSACSCTCQEQSFVSTWKSLASIVVGVGAVAGGIALTLGTSGYPLVAAAIAGGLSVGAGASMINHPISKMMMGERITGKEFAAEIATGSVVGVMTGGIGAAGSAIAEGAGCGVAKLGCKLGAGAMGGLSSSVYTSIFKDEDFSAKDGVLCGILGGAASHLSGKVKSKAGKTAICVGTKVGSKVMASRAKDVSSQVLRDANSGLNLKKLNTSTSSST